MKWLRQSTASQEIQLGKFVDDTDFKTAETALSIANTDIKIWKEGATTQASKNSGGATHIANGWYYCVLDATDTNTCGMLEVTVDVSGALSVMRQFMVVPAMIYDSLILGTDRLDTNVTHVADTAQTARDIGASVLLSSGTGTGQLDFTSGVVKSNLINIAGSAVSTSTAQLGVNVVNFGGSAGTFSSGRPEVNASHMGGTSVNSVAMPGQAAPSATPNLIDAIMYLYKAWRNKKTQTASAYNLFADDTTTVDQKATVSDDGTTTTVGEVASGP